MFFEKSSGMRSIEGAPLRCMGDDVDEFFVGCVEKMMTFRKIGL